MVGLVYIWRIDNIFYLGKNVQLCLFEWDASN